MDIGAELRAAREAKGFSLGTLAQRTRVQPRTLAAIESNDLAAIPPRPFGRGFVRAYAAEVDLDPERTVQSYFSQFPPSAEPAAPERSRASLASAFDPPSHWAGLGTAGAILAALVVVALIAGRGREPSSDGGAPADRSRDAIGTSGTTTRSAAPTSAPTDAASAPPSAATAPPPMRLTVAVTRPCWIAATADGQRTIYRIVQSGEKLSIDAQRDIAIRFGDAGAVEWTINGRKGASLGGDGVVRNLTCHAGECR